MIDLVQFLNVAGYVSIGWCGLMLILICYGLCIVGHGEYYNSPPQWIQILACPDFCFAIFNIIWASLGLYMYENEMNNECQEENIGTMIFIWSILQLSLTPLICCCNVCMICFSEHAGSCWVKCWEEWDYCKVLYLDDHCDCDCGFDEIVCICSKYYKRFA